MAETNVERLRRELRELEDKYNRNEIGPTDYFLDLEYLRNRLRDEQAKEVQIPYEPGFRERELYFDVQQGLEGVGTEVPRIYASEYEKQGVDPQEALERGKQKLEAKTRRTRYGTGEFVETMPTTFQVSDIVDPVKGLIEDPETRQVRKATDMEMIYSALFERQRKPTQLTTQEAIEQYDKRAQKIRRTKIQQKKAEKKYRPAPPSSTAGLFGVEVEVPIYEEKEPTLTKEELAEIDREVEEEMLSQVDVRRAPESPAVLAESSVDYGFRLFNTLPDRDWETLLLSK